MTSHSEGYVLPANLMLFTPPMPHRPSDLVAELGRTLQTSRSNSILDWILQTPSRKKNLNHPSALRVKDLKIGRTIVRFHLAYGEIGTYRVVSRVFVENDRLRIRLQDLSNGLRSNIDLSDLGVLPHNDSLNFVVDHRKRHLVAKPPFINSSVLMPSGPVGFGKTSLSASFYLNLLEERSE